VVKLAKVFTTLMRRRAPCAQQKRTDIDGVAKCLLRGGLGDSTRIIKAHGEQGMHKDLVKASLGISRCPLGYMGP